MQAVRRDEQDRAAATGRYAAMIQLAHPSRTVKDPQDTLLSSDLFTILSACRPQIIYTHNPADKHDTHLGVLVALIEALRALPAERRPAAVYGCEGWRNLDWLCDAEKIVHDLSGGEALEAELAATFASQIAGGKRYDLAVAGRHRANATYLNSHATDQLTSAAYAIDLTPLIRDPGLDLLDFTMGHIERFAADVRTRLGRRLGR
jgi:LmbE family N-acetylglucosaminyl deacetylase